MIRSRHPLRLRPPARSGGDDAVNGRVLGSAHTDRHRVSATGRALNALEVTHHQFRSDVTVQGVIAHAPVAAGRFGSLDHWDQEPA